MIVFQAAVKTANLFVSLLFSSWFTSACE